MVGHALPVRAIQYKQTHTHKKLMAEAVRLYAEEQARELTGPKDFHCGVRKIAQEVTLKHARETGEHIKLSYSTILWHHGGGHTMTKFNETKAWLNSIEEQNVVDYLLEVGSHGFPLTHLRLKEVVNSIIIARDGDPDFKGIGKQWTS
jgi:hypothetical protein